MTVPHGSKNDKRNDNILININGELIERDRAKISVFDSGFLLGDGVWEGLRLYHEKWVFLNAQLDRFIIDLVGGMLFALAHALKCLSKGAMEVLALSIKGNEVQALSSLLDSPAFHLIDPGGSSRHHEKHGSLTCR